MAGPEQKAEAKKRGASRALFQKGLPGKALNKKAVTV
jgi:ribosomal protein L35AE/L33A